MDDIKPVKPVREPVRESVPKPQEEIIINRPTEQVGVENPNKGYVQTAALSSMFGYWGVDRFYLGKVGTGILKLVTFGGFGLWYLVDVIIAIVGGARQKGESAPLNGTTKYKPFFVKLLVVWAIIYAVLFIAQTIFIAVALPKIINEAKKHDVCLEVDGKKECKPLQQFLDEYNKQKSDSGALPSLLTN